MPYLFDTSSIIALFRNEVGAERVSKLLKEVEESKENGYISTITLTEVYSSYAKSEGEGIANDRIEQIKGSRLKRIPVTSRIAVEAGKMRLKKMPTADSVIAASAAFAGAKLVAADKHFENSGVEVIKFR